MQIESNMSGHWSEEELIAYFYSEEKADSSHLSSCASCRARLETIEARRAVAVGNSEDWLDVSPAFLAEQRRRIYDRLTSSHSWWQVGTMWRWASAGTAAAALGAGLVIFSEHRAVVRPECKVSDAELAQEVSSLSLDSEARSAAPLKALFEY